MAIAAADAAYPIAMRADAVTGRKFGLVNCSNSSSTRKYAASNEGFLGCGGMRSNTPCWTTFKSARLSRNQIFAGAVSLGPL